MKNDNEIDNLNNETIKLFKIVVDNKKNIPTDSLNKMNSNIFSFYNSEYKSFLYNNDFIMKYNLKNKKLLRKNIKINHINLKKLTKIDNKILRKKLNLQIKIDKKIKLNEYKKYKHELKLENYCLYKYLNNFKNRISKFRDDVKHQVKLLYNNIIKKRKENKEMKKTKKLIR